MDRPGQPNRLNGDSSRSPAGSHKLSGFKEAASPNPDLLAARKGGTKNRTHLEHHQRWGIIPERTEARVLSPRMEGGRQRPQAIPAPGALYDHRLQALTAGQTRGGVVPFSDLPWTQEAPGRQRQGGQGRNRSENSSFHERRGTGRETSRQHDAQR